ncbi:embryo defective 3006 [Euphorbia peplus]|nr:embryo defective 3006 [Euphorbia peplus]
MESRHSAFRKSFKLAIRSLLTSCSFQEFSKAFSNFNNTQHQNLHHLFIQVITSLHKILEDHFELLDLENQVGTTLDTVDQLVEEQRLDPLFSKRTNFTDVAHSLTTEKKNEIQCLTGMLERVEEQNRLFRDRIELLKKGRHDVSGTADVEKLQSGILNYLASGNGL